MKINNKYRILLVVLALGLAMLSCSEVYVENTHQVFPVRVIVEMPGWQTRETRKLGPGESIMFQSEESGTYRVVAIPDEEYINSLKQTRDDMSQLLSPIIGTMSLEAIQQVTEEIDALNKLIENLDSVYCSGQVDVESTPSVTITLEKGIWSISCQ